MVLETLTGAAQLEPNLQLVLSLCSLVTMVTVLSACVCCKKPMKRRDIDPEDAYGVIPATDGGGLSPRVNFRFGHNTISERHSQPTSKPPNGAAPGSRTSAPLHPPRHLPPIPKEESTMSQLYSVIEKRTRKDGAPRAEDEIEYADNEGPTATYDTIDADSDIDGIYSKVGPSARRYDYPQFRRGPNGQELVGPAAPSTSRAVGVPAGNADPTYQSASQIYAPGSEDPYSSIASGPRPGKSAGDDDSSSAYDPGYARVRPDGGKRPTGGVDEEREIDQLYSKIRRSASRDASHPPQEGANGDVVSSAGPSASLTGLPGSLMDGDGGGGGGYGERRVVTGLPTTGAGDVAAEVVAARHPSDEQSVASRDPSYRYISVRETSDAVRARLAREGRDVHLYSTIDGHYETVDETRGPHPLPSGPIPNGRLSVNTDPSSSFTPQPPTSPIPGRGSTAPQGQPSPSARGGSVPASVGGTSYSNQHPNQDSNGPTPVGQLYAAINKSSKSSSRSPPPESSCSSRLSHPLPPSIPQPPFPGNGNASSTAHDSSSSTPSAHNGGVRDDNGNGPRNGGHEGIGHGVDDNRQARDGSAGRSVGGDKGKTTYSLETTSTPSHPYSFPATSVTTQSSSGTPQQQSFELQGDRRVEPAMTTSGYSSASGSNAKSAPGGARSAVDQRQAFTLQAEAPRGAVSSTSTNPENRNPTGGGVPVTNTAPLNNNSAMKQRLAGLREEALSSTDEKNAKKAERDGNHDPDGLEDQLGGGPQRNQSRASNGKAATSSPSNGPMSYSSVAKTSSSGASSVLSPSKTSQGPGSSPARSPFSPSQSRETTLKATVTPTRRGPGSPRHATVVKPEDDGFGGGPSVTRTQGASRPGMREIDEEKRLSGELSDQGTQTITRPRVLKDYPPHDGATVAGRRQSPVTVVSPGIGLENRSTHRTGGPTGTSMNSSMNESTVLPTMTSSGYSGVQSSDGGVLVGRRIVEEREMIVHTRVSSSSSSAAFSDDELEVGMSLVPASARNPGSRTRNASGGSQSARDARYKRESSERFYDSLNSLPRGMSVETNEKGERVYHVPLTLSASSQSLGAEQHQLSGLDGLSLSARSSRSSLPIRQNSEELRRAHQKSKERRESLEREEKRERDHSPQKTPRALSRQEKEEEMKKRLGTIYTGRDYVSPIDLTTERGWPLVGPSSPTTSHRALQSPFDRHDRGRGSGFGGGSGGGGGSGRSERRTGEGPMDDEELTPRAQPTVPPIDHLNNNNSLPSGKPPPLVNGLFSCDLSSSEESLVARRARYGGAAGAVADSSHAAGCPAAGGGTKKKKTGGGGGDEGMACYCHTGSARDEVWRSNHEEMDRIGYGRPQDEEANSFY